MNEKFIIYITETSVPSKSANLINSLKFCDAISKVKKLKVFFLLPSIKCSKEKIILNYNLKNQFTFISIINKKITNFFTRMHFAINCLTFCLLKKKSIIISRSATSSFLLALFGIKNTLEIHHEFKSLTLLFYKFVRKINIINKNIIFILIHEKLIDQLGLKNNYIVLDDGACKINVYTNKVKKKNTCIYMGSFFKGKGLEIIIKLAELMPNVQFDIFGDISTANKNFFKKKIAKNFNFKNFIEYSKVPKILSMYDVALMPYQKKIYARSDNLEISNYISPLKMFDYLSSKNIIISSRLNAYNHILKNNINSFLVNSNNLNEWKTKINYVFKNINKLNYIKINGENTANCYSWERRAIKFIKFYFN